MTDTEISTDWSFQGFAAVRMENQLLRVELLPAFGGKVWSMEYKPSGRQFLWHHPRHRLRSLPLGASYDDHFFGGFDELLPNDMPELVQGESLVDHGELWTTALSARIEGQSVVLSGELPITPLFYQKKIYLEGNRLVLDYELANIGRRPLDLLWKLHPALHISPGAELLVPAAMARVADPQWSRVKDRTEFQWPELSWLHSVPPLTGTTEFLYLLHLSDGRCALRHPAENWAFEVRFSKEVFTSVWLFASFGGWRNLELLILEPCTTPQLSLSQSAQARQCLHLEPGQRLQTTVSVAVGPADLR